MPIIRTNRNTGFYRFFYLEAVPIDATLTTLNNNQVFNGRHFNILFVTLVALIKFNWILGIFTFKEAIRNCWLSLIVASKWHSQWTQYTREKIFVKFYTRGLLAFVFGYIKQFQYQGPPTLDDDGWLSREQIVCTISQKKIWYFSWFLKLQDASRTDDSLFINHLKNTFSSQVAIKNRETRNFFIDSHCRTIMDSIIFFFCVTVIGHDTIKYRISVAMNCCLT